MTITTELPASPPAFSGTAAKAQVISLYAGMTPHQALQSIIGEAVHHLQNNVPGIILKPGDPEFIHQTRIALRRLRSAQNSFKRILADEPWQTLTPEIKWLTTLLGEARDLDVLLSETLPAITAACATGSVDPLNSSSPNPLNRDAKNEGTDLGAVEKAARKYRSRLQKHLRSALKSERYTALLLQLEALQQETGQPTDSEKLLDFARKSLKKNKRRVHRLARYWHTLDQVQRHDLRKRIKKLRYSAEFFSSLYQRKPVNRYLETLTQLQQTLGIINDAVATQKILALLIKHDPELRYPAGFIAGWQMREAKQAEADMERCIKDLKKAKLFW